MSAFQVTDVLPRFRSPSQTVPIDWERLRAFLQAHDLVIDAAETPRQFAGGLGNLNYLVSIGGVSYVLRRPPLGTIPLGANDMAREHRVLAQLWRSFPLAPRSIFYTADASVIGAHFLLMEYRPGLVIDATLPAPLDSRVVGPRLSEMLVDVLVKLHAVDAAEVGLGDFGRPAGFLRRNVQGWAKRAIDSSEGTPALVATELIEWLQRHQVPDCAPVLLHSDPKLDNLVLDPVTLAPRALLDWDMSTRGDPLLDLATLLSYWTEAGDPEGMRALQQMPTEQPGFASRAEIVSAYAARTGRDVSDFLFYRVLALFKLAIVFQQLHARFRDGATQDARYMRFGTLSRDILTHTHDVAFRALC